MKFGVTIGQQSLLELRFADDVVLVAQQKSDITKMLQHLSEAARKYGLEINYSKTKVLTRNDWARGLTHVQVEGHNVAVLPENEFEKYQGRKISFAGCHGQELQSRIVSGWATFHKYKAELCSKAYPLKNRIRLFSCVVFPVVLYGSATWALTQAMEKNLHAAWR